MKPYAWMLAGTFFCLPALALAQETQSNTTPASHAAQTAPQESASPQFDLDSASVRGIIRATATNQAGVEQESETAEASAVIDRKDLPFRAPRRMHHMKCDLTDCVAYTADGDALYTVPRDQYLGVNGGGTKDDWLTCQSGNDLLTTFERFDKCRGVSIGLPVQVGGTLLNVPLLDF